MGREILDRLAEPLVGGVHGSNPGDMSLAATFPNLLDMEQKYGNMIKGFLAQRKMVEEMRKKHPPDPKNPRTFFTAFTGGMHELTDAMAQAAGRDRIHTGKAVTSVARSEDGTWTVALDDGTTQVGDAVIFATESWAAEPLLRPVDTQIADALAAIPASSSATVSLAFREDEIGIDLHKFGVLCPLVEKRALLAATFSSSKWPGRAPKGYVLMRGFMGGPNNQAVMDKSDDEIVEIAEREMRDILGISPTGEGPVQPVLPVDRRHASVRHGPRAASGLHRRAQQVRPRPRAGGRRLSRRGTSQLHRERRGRREQGARGVGHRSRRGSRGAEAGVLGAGFAAEAGARGHQPCRRRP